MLGADPGRGVAHRAWACGLATTSPATDLTGNDGFTETRTNGTSATNAIGAKSLTRIRTAPLVDVGAIARSSWNSCGGLGRVAIGRGTRDETRTRAWCRRRRVSRPRTAGPVSLRAPSRTSSRSRRAAPGGAARPASPAVRVVLRWRGTVAKRECECCDGGLDDPRHVARPLMHAPVLLVVSSWATAPRRLMVRNRGYDDSRTTGTILLRRQPSTSAPDRCLAGARLLL